MKKKKRKLKIKYKNIILIIIILLLIVSLSYTIIKTYNNKKDIKVNSFNIDELNIDKDKLLEGLKLNKTERQIKLEELQKENKEIIGWLEIKDTNINYPVLQAKDNDYYLNHNYKKKKSAAGSLFLDASFDLEECSSNYLIYGHRNKNGLMFEDLMKYAKKDFYEKHKTFTFTTLKDDSTYEVLAVFYSRVYYKSEKDVFRYYYFVNAKNEDEFNDYVFNAKKASIYNTGVTANYGDQLITLSTCEYSQEDGRFVVVAKKINQD